MDCSAPKQSKLLGFFLGEVCCVIIRRIAALAASVRELPLDTFGIPVMNDPAIENAAEGLVPRVMAKRVDVERYLRAVGARHRRLITLTIIAAALATLLTASAAFGGQPLAQWLTDTFALSTPSWRILCAVAALCSLTAAVATQLHTSKNYLEHIARAQKAKASLEILEVAIALNHLDHHQATSEYLKIIETTSFIEPAAAVPTWPASPPASS